MNDHKNILTLILVNLVVFALILVILTNVDELKLTTKLPFIFRLV